MSRNKIQFILGILIALMPFTGFPPSWKTAFFVVVGTLMIIGAVRKHIERRSQDEYVGS